jgi:hypothetical protein
VSSPTKAKINLKEGLIELEGSEAFVTKHLEIFTKDLKKTKSIALQGEKKEETEKSDGSKRSEEKSKRKGSRSNPSVTPKPIDLDLKKKDDNPSLRDFVKEKKPTTFAEKLTVFAYYLKKNLKIDKMEAGHVVSCCNEIHSPVPRNIPQMFYDIQKGKLWLSAEDGRRYAVITTTGENYVEFDLPRKKNVATNKTTT